MEAIAFSSAELKAHYAAVRRRCFNPTRQKAAPDIGRVVDLADAIERRDQHTREQRRRAIIANWERRVKQRKEFERQLSYVGGKYRHTYLRIERLVCRALRITPMEIRGHRRHKEIAFARQAVMYWTARLTTHTYPEIARLMNKDHTSILHGAKVYPGKRAAQGRILKPAR